MIKPRIEQHLQMNGFNIYTDSDESCLASMLSYEWMEERSSVSWKIQIAFAYALCKSVQQIYDSLQHMMNN